jgi:hypothetical protein
MSYRDVWYSYLQFLFFLFIFLFLYFFFFFFYFIFLLLFFVFLSCPVQASGYINHFRYAFLSSVSLVAPLPAIRGDSLPSAAKSRQSTYA